MYCGYTMYSTCGWSEVKTVLQIIASALHRFPTLVDIVYTLQGEVSKIHPDVALWID